MCNLPFFIDFIDLECSLFVLILLILLILGGLWWDSFFFFFFFFSVSHFSIFLNVKDGATPLLIASQNGHEQIVRILLEKGNPNVDLPTNVIFLIVSFSFSFFFFSVSHFSIVF